MDYKICGYELDEQQKQIVLDDSKYLLVVAGAGSGKTLTILGKLYYLVEVKKIKLEEIICISFTKAASDSLRDKIKKEFNYDISVYTFHKLGLEILKERNHYFITESNTLQMIIQEFFKIDIFYYPNLLELLFSYFHLKNKEEYQKFYENSYPQVEMLERLLSTFIHLLKCNNYGLEDFPKFLKQSKKLWNLNYKKEKILLILALNIYLIYEDYLKVNHEIDFDDMLIKASESVKTYGYSKKIKYIIIDEYQDTSMTRFELIRNILESSDAKLMVVGDDFQSIYRFTGCDLSLFLNFQNYFQNSKVLKIENTYRNSQELIKIAGDFVMKNKEQIKKNLKSNKHIEYPIVLVYYNNLKHDFMLLIEKIYKETNKPILILGRNNKDIYSVLDRRYFKIENEKIIYLKNPKMNLSYLTVHKSKGLEEENVIILNLCDNILGFPNKVLDDKLLRFVIPFSSKYPYSEERRLFYVALTRTKNKVYLLTPKKDSSLFIQELLKDYKKEIEVIDFTKKH